MKILLVITKAEIGGAQAFVLNLAESLKIKGLDVEVAAGVGDYLPEELKKQGILFHRLHSLKRDYSIINSLFFIYDLFKLLRKGKYDIIHLNSTNTLIGAISAFFLQKRPKLVFTLHGLSFLDSNYVYHPLVNFFSKQYFKVLLRFIDKSVLVCKNNLETIIKGNYTKKYSVIYNGLDQENMEFYSPFESRKYLSEKSNIDLSGSLLVGSAGRLAYPKNYEFLIKNFNYFKEKIPNLKVVIIGDGPLRNDYMKLIEKYNIGKDFLLTGAIKDSYKYLKGFDVFTLTSVFEGLSISLIEALFAEVPILATNVGGNPEIVGNDKRQIFTHNDEKDYLEKLITLCQEKSLIVKNNIKLKSNFTLNKMAEEYIKIYKELINNK